jgi:hypothetical protein
MMPTTPQQQSTILSLFPDQSLYSIASKTGLSRSTIDRIAKKVEPDKENRKGDLPTKLSDVNKHSITCQITSGSIDNAVVATQFINSILPQPVNPQTIRKKNLHAVIKWNCPLLTAKHRRTT